jgi:prepilin-type N-terminal cleavage/methylation domain-containing protein
MVYFKKVMLMKSNNQARLRCSQSGFTLVELVMVTAIMGMLAVMTIFGDSNTRGRYRFSGAVERAKDVVLKAKNEANTTVNDGGGSAGTDINQVFFAKRVRLRDNLGEVEVATFATERNPSESSPLSLINSYTVTMEAGLLHTNGVGNADIWFVRWPVNGELYTYTPPPGAVLGAFGDFNPGNNRSARNYSFIDPVGGYSAFLTVDGMTSSVTRTFN